jgi:D-alanyl-lipoteichoic acid acyltransferase DltB (MBOAT superfamily)
LFNSLQFAVFFVAVLGALRTLPNALRNRILLFASLLFYSLWVPTYLVLLLGTLLVNYALLRAMERSARPRRQLIASIAITLGLLGVFKYSSLVVSTLLPLLQLMPGPRPSVPELMLPLGISFYSFEIISLAVDVYKRRQPCPSFERYALFVTFFPHLIAGPIMRGHELLPQLEAGGASSPLRTRRGLWLFASGLAKKALLADFLLAPFVNDVFAEPGVANAPAQLLAVYSFAFQIYFDFSGYTDMARGLACIMGFELPNNFAEPYLSRSPSEFWRRWHISLSRWLRDYLYIPLGGNRRGGLRTTYNLLATMLLGGLWHGAGWNFVVWGGLHGLLLGAERALGRKPIDDAQPLRWRDLPRIALVFHCVCWLWVAFRAPTLGVAFAIWRSLLTKSYFVGWPLLPLAVVLLCSVLHVAERAIRARLPSLHARVTTAVWGPAFEGAALGAIVSSAWIASGAGAEFIYFRF